MIENFVLGAGVKLANNVALTWFENQKLNARLSEAEIKGHIKLAEINSGNRISSFSRAIIFCMLTAAWCWMGIAGLTGMEVESSALIPTQPGFLARIFGSADMKVVDIKGSTLLYQWYQIMEMMMGAFVMKRK